MQRKRHLVLGAAVASLLVGATALAAIVDDHDEVEVLAAAPPSVDHGDLEDSYVMHAFDERQCRQLRHPLPMDIGGTVPTGTWVSSHFIHMDMADPPGKDPTYAVLEFDGLVLGAITSEGRLHTSDLRSGEISLLGSVLYPPSPSTRGLEAGDSVTLGQFTATLTLYVNDASDGLDQVRIITYCVPPNAN